MEKYLHQNYAPEERRQILEDSCDFAEKDASYTRTLTPNDIAIERERLSENSIKKHELDLEKKEAMKVFKEKIDPLTESIAENLKRIKTGKEELKGDLFAFKDHEEGMVYFYDELGELVYSRRLRDNETQKTIMTSLRQAK